MPDGPRTWPARSAKGEPSIEDALADPLLLAEYVTPYGEVSPEPPPEYEQQSLDEPRSSNDDQKDES